MKAKTIFDYINKIHNETTSSRGHGMTSMYAGFMLADQLKRTLTHFKGQINDTNPDGFTPLMLLIKLGYGEEFIAQAIALGADVTLTNKQKQTALHVAAANMDEDCVSILLNAGADPLAINSLGQTPIHIAASDHYSGNISTNGAVNVNLMPFTTCEQFAHYQDDDGNTILHLCIIHACLQDTAHISAYRHHPHLLKIKNHKGQTPLDIALTHEHKEYFLDALLEDLVSSGQYANIEALQKDFPNFTLDNINDNIDRPHIGILGLKLVHAAIKSNNLSMLQSLVEDLKCLVDYPEYLVIKTVMCAIEHNHKEPMQYLLNRDKTLIQKRDGDGMTPTLKAAACGHLELLSTLVNEHGGNVTDTIEKPHGYHTGQTTLSVAAQTDIETFQWILKMQPSLLETSLEKPYYSPMGCAIRWDKPDILAACLENKTMRDHFTKVKKEFIGIIAHTDNTALIELLTDSKLINDNDFPAIFNERHSRCEMQLWIGERVPELLIEQQSMDIRIHSPHPDQNTLSRRWREHVLRAHFKVTDHHIKALTFLHDNIETAASRASIDDGIHTNEEKLYLLYSECAETIADEVDTLLSDCKDDVVMEMIEYCMTLCRSCLPPPSIPEALQNPWENKEAPKTQEQRLTKPEIAVILLNKIAMCLISHERFTDAQKIILFINDDRILQKLPEPVAESIRLEIFDALLSGQVNLSESSEQSPQSKAIQMFGLLRSHSVESEKRKARLNKMLLTSSWSDAVECKKDDESQISTEVLKAFVLFHLNKADFATRNIVLEKLDVVFERLQGLEDFVDGSHSIDSTKP